MTKPQPEHHNPILITVLPQERRARHPYQVCVMMILITLAGSQLWVGPQASSVAAGLPTEQLAALNWFCLFAGLAGIAAAIIPERVVRLMRRFEFDATWVRLITEGAGQLALLFVWLIYLVAVLRSLPLLEGLSLGSAAAGWLAIAAGWRFMQIAMTVYRAIFAPPGDSALIGAAELKGQVHGG